jgi:hypothetical protein
MFDRISPEMVDELTSTSVDELTELSRSNSSPSELKDLAKLVTTIKGLGRTVHPVPSEGNDMLVNLDEESIRTVFPAYPGHEEARAAWGRHNKGTVDAFLRRKFGVQKTPEAFGAVAQDMAANGKSSRALEAAIAFCHELDP